MNKNLIWILLAAILLKAVYILISLEIDSFRNIDTSFNYETVINVLKKNDAYWYERIALNGYPPIHNANLLGYNEGSEFSQSEWAFFPFYPWLIHFTIKTFSLSANTSMLILSLIFSILAFILFYLFAIALNDKSKESFYNTLLLIVFPFHFYFSVFYTESIFLVTMIGSFYAILKKRFYIMSLLIIPMVLTRPNGLVILIPLYIFMLEEGGFFSRDKLSIGEIYRKANVLRTLYFLPGILAFIAYGFYQYNMTGEFFAFSIAQKGWYRNFMFPLLAFFRQGDLATQFNSIYTILFFLIAIISWRRLRLSFNLLIWLSLLLPLMTGSVMSMPRFISIIFPFFLIIGNYFFELKFKWGVLGILFLLQIVSFYFWIINDPISY